ncbi:MAG: response regulator [Aggregatilineales bacterium]
MSHILVVEDEKGLLRDIVEMLEFSYYEVSSAASGEEAIRLLQSIQPDLILCDVMMPGLDGYDVLAAVRSSPQTAATPFIFLTAKADRDELRHGMELGADDYLTKPFTLPELLTAINVRLRRHAEISEHSERQVEHLKQQLARMVTHELRTPLVSINTVLQVISRQLHQLSPAELQEMLDTIDAGSRRLSHRIEQMVYLTQLEAGLLSASQIAEKGVPTQMWDLLTAAVNLARRFAYNAPAFVDIELQDRDREAVVQCHPAALKQALAELISNAIKFSPENGRVMITQWVKDGYVWIAIVDHGAGIPEAQLRQALRAFQQIGREEREQQGIGIGLTLAQRIIDAHGGALDLRSTPGQGTQVIANIPLI